MPNSSTCCGLFAPLSRISNVPLNSPWLPGANSTEIVHVPVFAASVPHVFAVTLYGGVAAGAPASVIETALGLLNVTLLAGVTLEIATVPEVE